MKSYITVSFMLIILGAQGQAPSQKAFCKFVAAFNQQEFGVIYSELNDGFKTQVDRAVVAGGLLHVFETNGPIHSAVIERQTADEASYIAIGNRGIFRVLLSIDADERIDGLKIKVVTTGPPSQSPSLVFNNVRHEKDKTTQPTPDL